MRNVAGVNLHAISEFLARYLRKLKRAKMTKHLSGAASMSVPDQVFSTRFLLVLSYFIINILPITGRFRPSTTHP